jgi:hypothetical protein
MFGLGRRGETVLRFRHYELVISMFLPYSKER